MKNYRDPAQHGMPPQNVAAEESLISAILIDNSVLQEICDILRPQDFYKPAHQIIFAAILQLLENNVPVDLVTLTNRLSEQDKLTGVGGAVHLAQLVDSVPLAVNAGHYARIVHEKAILRSLIENGYDIIRRCLADRGNVDAVVDYAVSRVFKISEEKIKPAFFEVADLLGQSFDALEKRKNKTGQYSGVPSGFKLLDSATDGFQPSDLVILAARPSMGKTALALNIARNAAVEHGIPVAVFSIEMPKEQLVMRLLAAEARVSATRIRNGFLTKQDWDHLNNAGGILSRAPIYIDDAADTTALKLKTKARRLKMEKKIGLLIIDYLQLMGVDRVTERRDLDISEISRSLKGLAKELNIPVVALSQLNRALENRPDKRPRLADLRESGALEQDADVVVFIHRPEVFKDTKDLSPEDDGKAELIVAKQRNGPTASIELAFLKQYTRFENKSFS